MLGVCAGTQGWKTALNPFVVHSETTSSNDRQPHRLYKNANKPHDWENELKATLWTAGKRLVAAVVEHPAATRLGWIDPMARKIAPLVVRPAKVETSFSTPDGITLTVPPRFPSAHSYRAGVYETETVMCVRRVLGEVQGGFVDVGANVGYFALIAARLDGHRQVWAFEPDPQIHAYLRRNISANRADASVVAESLGVSDTAGSLRFCRDRFGSEGYVLDSVLEGDGAIEIDSLRLDDYFKTRGWPPVALIKLDIEGHEVRAIGGMPELLRRNPEAQLIVEVNPPALARSGTSASELVRILRDMGRERLTELHTGRTLQVDHQFRSTATVNLLASPG